MDEQIKREFIKKRRMMIKAKMALFLSILLIIEGAVYMTVPNAALQPAFILGLIIIVIIIIQFFVPIKH